MLKKVALTIYAAFMLAIPLLAVPAGVSAATDLFGVCKQGGGSSAACNSKEEAISGNNGIVLKAANLVAIIAGIAGIIMLMVGAFLYLTSGGDSGKVNSGKNTIIYALVGLIIVAIARTIVGFAISNIL